MTLNPGPTVPAQPPADNDTPTGRWGQFVNLTRSMVRPTLVWTGFGVLSAMVLFKVFKQNAEIPEWYQALVAFMVGYYFGIRTK